MKTLASLALALLAATAIGCGNKQDASPAPGASAAPASASGAAAAASGSAAPGGDKGAVYGSCVDKSSSICKEYIGALPLLAEDMCKGIEGKGVLTKGNVPCSHDNLTGTCDIMNEGTGERIYYYKQPDVTPEMNKTVCELLGKWTPAAKTAASAAPSAAPASAPPAKPASAPAKPAGAKKKK
jgi:hypothetical protein